MKLTRKQILLYGSIIVVGGILAYILIETIRAKNAGFETKTLWDWMELLIIPLVLAIGAFYLERSERAVERKIAEDRAELEREIALDRQQEAALQAYIDKMSELLLKEKLRTTKEAEVRDVARTRTISVMRGLDTRRNNLVTQFLREANLTNSPNSILNSAEMVQMDLEELDLNRLYLQGANLEGANLQSANLQSANLRGAWLHQANLQSANLRDAIFQSTSLQDANLKRATLRDAFLQGAILEGANLQYANLQGANLQGANLQDAYLIHANLQGAKVANEQLATVKSLKGAIMPDGTKHD